MVPAARHAVIGFVAKRSFGPAPLDAWRLAVSVAELATAAPTNAIVSRSASE
jgi:hypothetical protein